MSGRARRHGGWVDRRTGCDGQASGEARRATSQEPLGLGVVREKSYLPASFDSATALMRSSVACMFLTFVRVRAFPAIIE